MIDRALLTRIKKSKKSILLLGPRQTGKSTLIKSLDLDLNINLADERVYLDFARNPSELRSRLNSKIKTVFIDEVQRLPGLLNSIQAILDEASADVRFYLTGSSARKLKRGQANLLPGRIHSYQLGPLISSELSGGLISTQALETGTLPGIYTEKNPAEREETLRSYSATYLREEVQAEALTRNIEGFARFLEIAATCSGQFLDLAKFSSEAQIPRQSAVRYFEILEDTLIVRRCPPFAKSERRRLIQHPRYFFFDTGVLNGTLGNFRASPERKGFLLEHLFFNQLIDTSSALNLPCRVSSFRTEHGAEVDFIVEVKGSTYAVEVKASRNVGKNDLRGFQSFGQIFGKPHTKIVAFLGEDQKQVGDVTIMPWQKALAQVFI